MWPYGNCEVRGLISKMLLKTFHVRYVPTYSTLVNASEISTVTCYSVYCLSKDLSCFNFFTQTLLLCNIMIDHLLNNNGSDPTTTIMHI